MFNGLKTIVVGNEAEILNASLEAKVAHPHREKNALSAIVTPVNEDRQSTTVDMESSNELWT